MSNLKKKIDKKVNFEFNKEYIKVIEEKIQKNDVNLLLILLGRCTLLMQQILLNT